MKNLSVVPVILLALAACVETSTTRLANNVIRIDVSAEPACGLTGAQKVVNEVAALETLRLGFDKYFIAGTDAQNNVRVVGYTSYASGTYGYGSFNASGYSSPIIAGSHDSSAVVVMFRSGDPEAKNAIDARSVLGADWLST